MDHMKMRWIVDGGFIVTEEFEPWFVAKICEGLPGDHSGRKTAQAICDHHNAQIERSKQ